MPDVERELLRRLLSDADSGKPISGQWIASLNRDAEVMAVARKNRLSPLLGAFALPEYPVALADAFRRDRLTTLGRSTLLRRALANLFGAFDRAAVKVVALKGIAYDDLFYPQPGTRPASDIDLLVKPSQRRDALAVLQGLAYVPYASSPGFDQPDYHEISFRSAEANLDLHFALAPLVRCRIDYDDVWSHLETWVFEGRPTQTLGHAHAALNQALHMAIHHFDVPASYLIDFRRIVDAAGPSGPTDIERLARAWRCERPLQTTLRLCEAFLEWSGCGRFARDPRAPYAERVVAGFGSGDSPVRREQLIRKVTHFDKRTDAGRYLWVQGQRILRERWLQFAGPARSASERIGYRP